jgi:hypothetical protein
MRPRQVLPATLLALAFAVLACAFPTSATPGPTPTPGWETYSNRTFGFSISHPPGFQTPAEDAADPFGYIGEQVFFNVTEVSPLDCRGDCPVIETNESVLVAGLSATRLTGFIGSVGGNVPQQYQSYVFENGGRFYNLTLYALPRGAAATDIETLQPLKAEDVQVFEQMLATFKFTP